MFLRILISLAVCLLVLGCESKLSKTQDENHQTFDDIMTLTSTSMTELPLSSQMGFIHSSLDYQLLEGHEYLSFFNFMKNEIVVFDYESSKLIQQVVLEVEGPDGVGSLSPSTAHYMIARDSFLILNTSSFVLYLVDKQARVMNKFRLLDLKNDDFSAVPRPTSLNPILKIGNYVYLSCAVNSRRMNYDGYATVLKLNLKTGLAEYMFELPDIYSEQFWATDFKYWVSMAHDEKQDRLVLSYPVIHELYIGNKMGQFSGSHYVGSNHIGKIPGWSDDLSIGLQRPSTEDFKKMTNFDFSNSDYASIKYDPYRNLFYRIVHVRPDLETVKTSNRIPDISIMILTNDFKKVGEVSFDGNVYNHSMIFVSKEGLNLARKDLYRQNENLITFETFRPDELR